MSKDIDTIRHLYERFNARDIEGVLAHLGENVAWANGMDGGHVHGRAAVREYWTRQWEVVSPHVEAVTLETKPDESIAVSVRQTVRDLEGKPLEGQTHGLKDKLVGHRFHLEGGKVVRFDIEEV